MLVRVKKTEGEAVVPKYESFNAAGFDIHVVGNYCVAPKEVKLLSTGLQFEFAEACKLEIVPRSGLSLKWPNYVANSPATIDADYRGELKIIVVNNTDRFWKINHHDRIAQGVFVNITHGLFVERSILSETERGSDGFGSTGL